MNSSTSSHLRFFRTCCLALLVLLSFSKQNTSYAQCSDPSVTISYTIDPPTCTGESNGSVTVVVTGARAPYSYTILGSVIGLQTGLGLPTSTHTFTGLPNDPNFSIIVQAGIVGLPTNAVCNVSNLSINAPDPIVAIPTITDVNCDNENNGAISLNVTGGTAPYTYAWSNGATTQNISGLSAGSYSVTITDVNGCEESFTFSVNEPLPLSITSNSTNVSCNGGSDGSITITPAGGVSPYSFVWSNGATTQNISGLQAGSYSVILTDNNGCQETFNFTITTPDPISITSAITPVACNGGNDGSISITSVTGGTGTYSFLWSNGATSQNLTNVPAGSYSVTVTDANGCPQVYNFNITEPDAISITSSVTSIACNGASSGSIQLNTVTGGTPGYTFLWNTGATTQDINGLSSGNYSVTVTDAHNCSQQFNFTITATPPITITSAVSNTTCNGASNGSITINSISGGTAPYSFLWSNGSTSQNINGLTAGTYSLTITDANNCTQVFNFNVTEPDPIAVTSSITPVACNGGNNGAIDLTSISGGTAPYTYAWSNGNTSQNINGLAAGAYSVTITDASGCPGQVFNFNVTESDPIAATSSITPVACNGGNNGAIDLTTVTGGTAPYSFLWSNGNSSQNINGLAAGSYSVTVTDANNCTQVFNFNITEPDPIAVTSSITAVTCNGGNNGAIDLTSISGGTAPYSFLWSNGSTSQNINGLVAGAYSVTITDANNCTQVFNFNITEPDPIAITSSITAVTCNGGNNGAIDLTSISGGTAPYSFLWSNGSTSQNINGLTAGTYSLTITDANNCTQVFNFNVTEPDPIAVTSSITPVACNGGNNGAIDLTSISGGTAPYMFAWSNGNTSQNINGLAAGAYSVTITDASGCPGQVFNFNVTESDPIAATSSITPVACNGGNNGAIDLTTVTGGTAPYSFLWSNGSTSQNINGLAAGSYSVTVTDANNCTQVFNFNVTEPDPIAVTSSITAVTCNGGNNGAIDLTSITGGTTPYSFLWSNGSTSQNINGLAAGAYSVTITDANNCTQVFNLNITEPDPIAIASSITAVTCNGGNNGAIDLTSISGGTAPYSFLWSNGSTSQNINGLTAGAYSLTVTDANNCPQVFNFNVTESAPISITSSINNVTTCGGSDGSIALTNILGGTAPYTFAWSNGDLTQNVSGLLPGNYTVTVTDNNGCHEDFSFSISDPTPFTVTSALTHVNCAGEANGAISHVITGGTAPFTISWNTGATTSDITGLTAGTYLVSITDASNCTYNGTYSITEPSALTITSSTTDVTTCSGTNGAIDITAISGGTPNYSFAWSNGATTQSISGLSAGNYSLTITDANACHYVYNFSISDPVPFTVSAITTDITCNGGNNGAIDQTITGGTAPFNISWNTGATSEDLSGLTSGSYIVSITDASNCVYNHTYILDEPEPITILSTVTDVSACSGNNGAILITTVTGGSAPYSFLWSNGATTQNITGLAAGAYSITITDANNCTPSVFNFTVSDPVPYTVSNAIAHVTCNGSANGSIDLTINGGAAPFSIQWSNGATTEDLTGIAAGTYTVTITDAGNCSFTESYHVSEPTPLSILSDVTDVTCNGGSNGSIELTTISGATAPYTFLWSNGATTQNITAVSAGNYSVVITDANGCPQTFNFTLNEPAPLTATETITSPSTCGGNDATIVISNVNGGVVPYTFNWSTGATGSSINSLSAGTYNVTITDANGCARVFSYSVSDPVPFTVTPTITAINCHGESNGEISLAIADGTAPITILWNTGATTNTIVGLSSGMYSVSIKDAAGCEFTNNYNIHEPAPISIVSSVSNTSNCSSSDGSITVSNVLGGTPAYSFAWSNGANTQSINGLSDGNYSLTITDQNNCSNTYNFAISNPSLFTVSSSIVNLTCGSTNSGAIHLSFGGTIVPPLNILWNTGETTPNLTGLSAGNYSVDINDATGCSFHGAYTITEPSSVDTTSIIDIKTPVLCSGSNEGSIVLTNVSGGAAPYTYTLNGISSTTPSFDKLVGGDYTITITDANGCEFYHSFNIFEPAPIAYAVSTTPAVCTNNNGTLSFGAVTGGTPTYLYSVDSGVTYSTQTTFTGLAPGTYNVFVKDANLCTYGYNIAITLKPGPVPYFRVIPPSCHGGDNGAIVIDSLVGGVFPFTFYINGQTRGSSKVFPELTSGGYSFKIEDQECTYNIHDYFLYNNTTFKYDTIVDSTVVFVPQPAPIQASVMSEDTYNRESTGVVTLFDFTGGTAPYQYSLDTTLGYTPLTNSILALTGLDKGYYKVFLKDTNECKAELTVQIKVGFFIPNLITPNSDGQNDYFEIMALPLRSTLSIYNSWNTRIYHDTNYNNSWEAKGESDGVYYYELVLPDGKQYKGWLQVLR